MTDFLGYFSLPPPPKVLFPGSKTGFFSLGVHAYHTTSLPQPLMQFLLFATGLAELTEYNLPTYASTKYFALIIPA